VNLRLCVAVLLLLPPAAFAQGNPGPFGGLFGRTPERVGKDYRVFEVRTSGGAQYENSILDDSVPAGSVVESGAMGTFNVGGMFEERSSRFSLRLNSMAAYQQYLDVGAIGGTAVTSSAQVTSRVLTRLALDGTINHLYTPFFQFHRQYPSLSPTGALVPPSSPYVATLVESNTYEAVGGVTSYYSKHSTVGAAFSRRETRFSQAFDERFSVTGMRGSWTRQLNRDLRLRLGYGRESIRQSSRSDQPYIHELVDVGVDFERVLSVSRRTALGFATETSIVRKPGTGRHYRLNGRILLSSWLRRTWQASINANRQTEFLPGFIEPLFSDNVGAALAGLFSKRVEMILSVAAGRGTFGLGDSMPGGDRFTIGNGTAQLNYAVTRHVGVFGQYALNHFEMPPEASSIAPLDRLTRQTFIVGVTAWIPMYTQERGVRDSR
jgi:hypothetical protein